MKPTNNPRTTLSHPAGGIAEPQEGVITQEVDPVNMNSSLVEVDGSPVKVRSRRFRVPDKRDFIFEGGHEDVYRDWTKRPARQRVFGEDDAPPARTRSQDAIQHKPRAAGDLDRDKVRSFLASREGRPWEQVAAELRSRVPDWLRKTLDRELKDMVVPVGMRAPGVHRWAHAPFEVDADGNLRKTAPRPKLDGGDVPAVQFRRMLAFLNVRVGRPWADVVKEIHTILPKGGGPASAITRSLDALVTRAGDVDAPVRPFRVEEGVLTKD